MSIHVWENLIANERRCYISQASWYAGLTLGLRPANERRRYSHWSGASLESALICIVFSHCMRPCSVVDKKKNWLRFWPHNWYPISRPHGQSIGCALYVFCRRPNSHQGTTLYNQLTSFTMNYLSWQIPVPLFATRLICLVHTCSQANLNYHHIKAWFMKSKA